METKKICGKWYFSVLIPLIVILISACGSSASNQSSTPDDPVQASLIDAGIKDATITSKDDYIEISYTLKDTPYDYTDYVSKGLSHYVKTAKGIFEKTDYTTLRMDMMVDGSAATSLIMTKDNFNSIDWSSIAYTEGIYNKIQGNFQKFYVESMLMKGVDTDKIMYKGN